MILEDHQKLQPAEGGKVSERWVGKLSKRCVQLSYIVRTWPDCDTPSRS